MMLAAKPPLAAAYAPDVRVAHLLSVINAVQITSRDVLIQAYQYGAVYERGACSSSSERLRAECLMTAAKRFCQKRPKEEWPSCVLYSDMVVSNLLAEKRLVSNDKRYEIMKRTREWRHEVVREIRRAQGALAVDYRLRMGEATDAPTLARNIDAFCLQTADATGLSWQVCASSLLWFIGAGAPEL
jgi:hypothetical protein